MGSDGVHEGGHPYRGRNGRLQAEGTPLVWVPFIPCRTQTGPCVSPGY